MFTQSDPFRAFDGFFDQLPATRSTGAVPLDAYRRGENVWVHLDLPGVATDSIDIDVERNVLTVIAERSWSREDDDQVYLNERRQGAYRRQVHLGDGLDVDGIEADYHDGVLTLRIPVSERAKPRKIAINTGSSPSGPVVEAELAES